MLKKFGRRPKKSLPVNWLLQKLKLKRFVELPILENTRVVMHFHTEICDIRATCEISRKFFPYPPFLVESYVKTEVLHMF